MTTLLLEREETASFTRRYAVWIAELVEEFVPQLLASYESTCGSVNRQTGGLTHPGTVRSRKCPMAEPFSLSS